MLLSITPSINRIPGKKSTIFLPYEGGAANPSHKKTQVDVKDPNKVIAAKPPSRQKTRVDIKDPNEAIVQREKHIAAKKKNSSNGDDAITVATKKSTTFKNIQIKHNLCVEYLVGIELCEFNHNGQQFQQL